MSPVNASRHLYRFFPFFGGKRQHARHYPAPRHNLVVEPFAGSAGYATYHHSRSVLLLDVDPAVVSTWRYLIRVEPEELLALPDVPAGGTVHDTDMTPEQKVLAGWWLSHGRTRPATKPSSWARSGKRPNSYWGPGLREKLARQVPLIRHWKILEASWHEAPDSMGCWFIDPPYQGPGTAYRYGSEGIDYQELGEWCRNRRGQVIVCEQHGADWLPFREFRSVRSSPRGGGRSSREVIWLADAETGVRPGAGGRPAAPRRPVGGQRTD